MDIVTAVVRGF